LQFLAIDPEFHPLNASRSARSCSDETHWRVIGAAGLRRAYMNPRRIWRRTLVGCSTANCERVLGFQERSGRIDFNDCHRMLGLRQTESGVQFVIEGLELLIPVNPYLNAVHWLNRSARAGHNPGWMHGRAAVGRKTEVYPWLIGIRARIAGIAGGVQKGGYS